MKDEKKLGAYFKSISNALDRKFNKDLDEFDLTASQANILIYLFFNRDKEISQTDIQDKFSLTNPTVTGILKRLESKNFIIRNTSGKDERRKVIKLTEKSIGLDQKLFEGMIRVEDQMTYGFSEQERKLLETLLQRVLHNIA